MTHCQGGEQRGRCRHSRRRSVRPHKAALLPIQVQLRDDTKQRWEIQPLLPFFPGWKLCDLENEG